MEEFPTADIRRSLYEIDGNRVTCGGGMAALDMLHGLLLQKHGKQVADSIAEWFLHTEVREGGKPQRSSACARFGINHKGLARVLETMERSLEEPVSHDHLATIAGVSQRQLARLFHTYLNQTIGAYYLQLRLQRAHQLVLQSNLSQLEITFACGFKSPSSFSKAYRAEYGVSPRQDRAKVRRAAVG